MAEKDWIQRYFAPLAGTTGAAGLTDDVALLTAAGPTIITTDTIVEGIHFRGQDPVAFAAVKLVRANVSDILAKGAKPVEALLNLGWPPGRDDGDLEAFAGALAGELGRWGIDLIGGDTVSSPGGLHLSMTLTGRCIGEGPVRRRGAQPGDTVWVTGDIGAAYAGYQSVLAGHADATADRYWRPKLPKAAIADLIAQYATASMDVSDGLLMDAAALAAASGGRVVLEMADIPLFDGDFEGGGQTAIDPMALMTWGEDYQALFATPSEHMVTVRARANAAGLTLSKIGDVRAGSGLILTKNGARVNLPETLGFEHG